MFPQKQNGDQKQRRDNGKIQKIIELYSQTNNNKAMKIHCRKYCKILTLVIREAKHMHYKK